MFKPMPTMPTKTRFARAMILLAVSVLMLAAAAPMRASDDPIPGVDVVVRKKPSGVPMVVASSNSKGQFSGRVSAGGQYTISLVCKTEPCPRFTVTLSASGKVLRAKPDGTYDLTVEDRMPVTLTGQVTGSAEAVEAPAKKMRN